MINKTRLARRTLDKITRIAMLLCLVKGVGRGFGVRGFGVAGLVF